MKITSLTHLKKNPEKKKKKDFSAVKNSAKRVGEGFLVFTK